MKKKQAQVISILNQKGGTAKTSTSHALGAGLALRGYKVLFLDLDAQFNLSYSMKALHTPLTSLEVLTGTATAEEAIVETDNASIIPSSPSLAGADLILQDKIGKEYLLKEALEPIKGNYDYIVVDTPPALNSLTVNALTASDKIIIPAQADIFSLQGIASLAETVNTIKRRTNPALKIDGILITRYNGRASLSRELKQMLETTAQQLSTKVYSAQIRENISIKEAQAFQQDIFTYAPQSNGATDYNSFIDEFLKG